MTVAQPNAAQTHPLAASAQPVSPETDVLEDVIFPSGNLLSDEPPLETELHLRQLVLLIQCLEWWWHDRQDFYAFGNLTIYYSPRQRKSENFRGPDFFVVLGTERKTRNSWVVWEEDGKYPNVIVEILSPKTVKTDRGAKKQLYQETFRTPDYFGFDPKSLEFKGFHWVDGQYQELEANEQGWLWSQQLGLWLGVAESKLRLFAEGGQLIPTPRRSQRSRTSARRTGAATKGTGTAACRASGGKVTRTGYRSCRFLENAIAQQSAKLHPFGTCGAERGKLTPLNSH